MEGTVSPVPPPAPKKKVGLVIGLLVGAAICLCLLAILSAVIIVLLRPGFLQQLQGNPYTNQQLGISLYYPYDWVYEEASDSVTFASSQDVLENGPESGGAGLMVMRLDRRAFEAYALIDPDFNPDSPQDILSIFSKEQNTGMNLVQPINAATVSGYPSAEGVFVFLDEETNTPYHMNVFAIVAPDYYYFFIGACRESDWNQYASTLKGMIKTVQIGP